MSRRPQTTTATAPTVRKIRCAVYTRKSTDEGLDKEFNSLDAQRESCEAYVTSQRAEGWVLVRERYDDGGVSGGTLERPALKRLITDIEEGLIPRLRECDSGGIPRRGAGVILYPANDGGSLCRLHFGLILMLPGFGWRRDGARMRRKRVVCWRLQRSMTVRHAPKRRGSVGSRCRSSATGW